MSAGSLALVGSGEYLPSMRELESELLENGVDRGKRRVFVQLATAAGREGDARLHYWRQLGEEQGRAMNVDVDFLPVFDRESAQAPDLLSRVRDAALVYFSGGDPHHLADSMRGTDLWAAIKTNYESGGSLAGCSAGAMFLSAEVPSLRFHRKPPVAGVGLLPSLQVIPHYDKIGKWIPDAAIRLVTTIPAGVTLVGIDEETALVHGRDWRVWGRGAVHIINGPHEGQYIDSARVPLA